MLRAYTYRVKAWDVGSRFKVFRVQDSVSAIRVSDLGFRVPIVQGHPKMELTSQESNGQEHRNLNSSRSYPYEGHRGICPQNYLEIGSIGPICSTWAR